VTLTSVPERKGTRGDAKEKEKPRTDLPGRNSHKKKKNDNSASSPSGGKESKIKTTIMEERERKMLRGGTQKAFESPICGKIRERKCKRKRV